MKKMVVIEYCNECKNFKVDSDDFGKKCGKYGMKLERAFGLRTYNIPIGCGLENAPGQLDLFGPV